MKCHFELENGDFCQKAGAKGRAFCAEHKAVTAPLYFTADYAEYEKLDEKYISPLIFAEYLIARGVALKHDLELEKIADEVVGNKLRFVRTKSEEKRKKLFIAVRYMISDKEELGLFRFFNTDYEPHHKVLRDFITHQWFTDEERAYLQSFIQKHFIDRITLRHQINALTGVSKRRKNKDFRRGM